MPRKLSSLDDLKRRQREDVEAQFESEWAGKLVPHGPVTRSARWFSRNLRRWTERINRLANWAKGVGILLGAAATIWQAVRSWWGRDVPPPELPKTGQPTTAVDFVPEPKRGPAPSPDDLPSSKK